MTSFVGYPGHELLRDNIVRAENCYLYDSQDRKYVDLESGVWCTGIGQGNPRLVEVMAEQARWIGHTGFNYSSPIVEDAAREILALHGMEDGKCVFLCSGSEAVEYGVRIIQRLAPRPYLMTLSDSYFGAYGAAAKRPQNEWYSFDWSGCADCPESVNCAEHCELWQTIPYNQVGAFIFEPGSSSGFVRFPPAKLIRSIVSFIDSNDGYVLANEVTTGVGRTGKWFGYQHYGLTPDIVAMGKGLGNGYPVSATALSAGVMRKLGDEPPPYAQSHQNDPLGAAMAREVVHIIQEGNLIARSVEISAVLMTGLLKIKMKTGKIAELRGRGLMVAVDLKDDEDNSFTTRVHRELVDQGFLVCKRPSSHTLRIDPALTVEIEDIKEFLRVFEDVLTDGS